MTHSGHNIKKKLLLTAYHNLLCEFKSMQTGYSAIAIIGQSCLGSIAAMMVLMSDLSKVALLSLLFLVTIFCMAYNAAVLAQLKPRTIFNLLILSVLFSCILIAAFLV
jgi:hypothetical protein